MQLIPAISRFYYIKVERFFRVQVIVFENLDIPSDLYPGVLHIILENPDEYHPTGLHPLYA